jgi:hypothetical protein
MPSHGDKYKFTAAISDYDVTFTYDGPYDGYGPQLGVGLSTWTITADVHGAKYEHCDAFGTMPHAGPKQIMALITKFNSTLIQEHNNMILTIDHIMNDELMRIVLEPVDAHGMPYDNTQLAAVAMELNRLKHRVHMLETRGSASEPSASDILYNMFETFYIYATTP